MIAYRIVAVLALVAVAYADTGDLEQALKMMACANKAMRPGVPELGVPPHEPFVAFSRNLSWKGDIGVASVEANFNKLSWAGLPEWDVSGKQNSKDSDVTEDLDFTIYWPWFQINGTFKVVTTELFLHQTFKGTFSVDFEKNKWTGKIRVVKGQKPKIEKLNINWHVDDVDAEISGLGILEKTYEITVAETIEKALNTGLIGNKIGDFLNMRLSNFWFSNGKIWDLMKWCEDHQSTTAAPSSPGF